MIRGRRRRRIKIKQIQQIRHIIRRHDTDKKGDNKHGQNTNNDIKTKKSNQKNNENNNKTNKKNNKKKTKHNNNINKYKNTNNDKHANTNDYKKNKTKEANNK